MVSTILSAILKRSVPAQGLLAVLNPFVENNSIGELGRLATGYVEYPDDHHTASEVTWVTACLLFAL